MRRETVRSDWSLAAENAGDRGWLSPVGEKRLRASPSAARRQLRGSGVSTGGAARRAGPRSYPRRAGPGSAAPVRTSSLARTGPLAHTRQEKPFVS